MLPVASSLDLFPLQCIGAILRKRNYSERQSKALVCGGLKPQNMAIVRGFSVDQQLN
jgi:hypothetical protein